MEILRFKRKVREMVIWEWHYFEHATWYLLECLSTFHCEILWFSLGAQNTFIYLQGLRRGIDLCPFIWSNVYISVTYLYFLYIMCHDLSIALNCSTSCQLFVWINTDNVFINLKLTTVLGWLNFRFCLMLQSLRYNLQSDTFNLIVWSVEKYWPNLSCSFYSLIYGKT